MIIEHDLVKHFQFLFNMIRLNNYGSLLKLIKLNFATRY